MFEPIPCPPNRQRELNKFYKKHKQNVSCNLSDKVYISTSECNEIVAAVIVRSLPNTQKHLLRSLFVSSEYRNKGIASSLCRFAISNQVEAVFTLFEPELLALYTNLGFQRVNAVDWQALENEPQIQKQIKKGLLLMSKPSQNN